MLKSFEIINFQSHPISKGEFHKGVNVFKGTSHHGKSAIIRAIKWAIRNDLDGNADAYKATFSGKNDEFSCKVSFDEGWAKRGRIKKSNFLNIQTGDKKIDLEAIRSDIPEELSTLTRMTDLNIQEQHDGFFMLSDNPGERGKKLSKILGLEIITTSIDNAKREVRECEDQIKFYDKEIENNTEKLSQHKNFATKEKKVKELNNLFSNLKSKEEQKERLDLYLTKIKEEQEEAEDLSKIVIEVGKKLGKAKAVFKELKEIQDKTITLRLVLNSVDKNQRGMESLQKILNSQETITALRKTINKSYSLVESTSRLGSVVNRVSDSLVKIKLYETDITKLNSNIEAILKENKNDICSCCGSFKSHWRK